MVEKKDLYEIAGTEARNKFEIFTELNLLFQDKLWQEKNDEEIKRMLRTILVAIQYQPHSENNPHEFCVGNFVIKMDPKNIEHLIINKNKNEQIIFTLIKNRGNYETRISKEPT